MLQYGLRDAINAPQTYHIGKDSFHDMTKPNLTPPVLTKKQILRFWSYVDTAAGQGPNGDCWEWTRKRSTRGGYGHYAVGTRHYRATRLAFFLTYGYWPNPNACHHCDNPPCCRPDHLFEGDTKKNMEDAVKKGRLQKGETHHTKRHPEQIPRGTKRYWSSKLTEEQVKEIRKLHKEDGVLQKHLAVRYAVCKQTINLVVNNKIWTHV